MLLFSALQNFLDQENNKTYQESQTFKKCKTFDLLFTLKHRLRWVWDWFKKADKNKDGKMTFKEVRTLLKMMNVDMNEEHALHLFTVSHYCFFWKQLGRKSTTKDS